MLFLSSPHRVSSFTPVSRVQVNVTESRSNYCETFLLMTLLEIYLVDRYKLFVSPFLKRVAFLPVRLTRVHILRSNRSRIGARTHAKRAELFRRRINERSRRYVTDSGPHVASDVNSNVNARRAVIGAWWAYYGTPWRDGNTDRLYYVNLLLPHSLRFNIRI